jgi:hypothetical protein
MNLIHIAFLLSVLSLSNASPMQAILDHFPRLFGVSGKDALIRAVISKNLGKVERLLKSSYIRHGDITGDTLNYAVIRDQPGVLEALLASDKFAEGVSGQWAFNDAVEHGLKAAAMALLNSKLGEKIIITVEMKPMVEKLLGEEVNLA